MFLATFFNVTFYSEIMAALNGRGVSLRRGLSLACGRRSSILRREHGGVSVLAGSVAAGGRGGAASQKRLDNCHSRRHLAAGNVLHALRFERCQPCLSVRSLHICRRGVVPEPYDQNLLDMAWKVKKA
jgi:hypothetical protein